MICYDNLSRLTMSVQISRTLVWLSDRKIALRWEKYVLPVI